MRISNYSVEMNAKVSQSKKFTEKQTLLQQNQSDNRVGNENIKRGNLRLDNEKKQMMQMLQQENKLRKRQSSLDDTGTVTGTENDLYTYSLSDEDLQKIRLLEKILSELTGKEIKFVIPRVNKEMMNSKDGQVINSHHNDGVKQSQPQAIYEREVHYKEHSSYSFNATGSVTTADGRQIEFALHSKSEQFFEYHQSTLVDINGKQVDPLVLQYEGTLPALSQNKYAFDLDFDGQSDQISFLEKGSAFLALDRNEDGSINDGRELFGAATGNGFNELSHYDSDKNGWIDENDMIFDKLRLWLKHDDGTDELVALGEKGIGAIYLGNLSTPYQLKSAPNQVLGTIKNSGLFLKESGEAGHIQHIDMQL